MVRVETENVHLGVKEVLGEAEVVHTAGEGGGRGMRMATRKERRRVMKDIVRTAALELMETVVENSLSVRRSWTVLLPPNLSHHHHLLVKGSPQCRQTYEQPIQLTFFTTSLNQPAKTLKNSFYKPKQDNL